MCVFYTFQQKENKESKLYDFLEVMRTENVPQNKNRTWDSKDLDIRYMFSQSRKNEKMH